ncbi:MAG: purine-binding chemotaxis protein CheW [Lachnospiraceae bacterium]|nr:purine-binding chemotaxis protein CheW [Lachnospiraceae bacterium]
MEERENIEEEMLEEVQYIVVKLGQESYGIKIDYVDNIVRMPRITRVPKSQPYFVGVINLRGEVVPVMSLRRRFGMEEDVYVGSTRIIIIKLEDQTLVGMLVDEVREVVDLDERMIESPNFKLSEENAVYFAGIGKNGDNLISLLDIESVVKGKKKHE